MALQRSLFAVKHAPELIECSARGVADIQILRNGFHHRALPADTLHPDSIPEDLRSALGNALSSIPITPEELASPLQQKLIIKPRTLEVIKASRRPVRETSLMELAASLIRIEQGECRER